jgi:hypothetical protein
MIRHCSLALFAALMLTLAACGGDTAPPAPSAGELIETPETEPSPLPPITLSGDALTVADALRKLDNSGPYRINLLSSFDPNAPVEVLVVPPDRSHYKSSVDGAKIEFITVGEQSWALSETGEWTTASEAGAGANFDFGLPRASDPNFTRSFKDAAALGVQADGTAYAFKTVEPGGADKSVTMWLNASGQPVKFEVLAPDEKTTVTVTYDATIAVSAPN